MRLVRSGYLLRVYERKACVSVYLAVYMATHCSDARKDGANGRLMQQCTMRGKMGVVHLTSPRQASTYLAMIFLHEDILGFLVSKRAVIPNSETMHFF